MSHVEFLKSSCAVLLFAQCSCGFEKAQCDLLILRNVLGCVSNVFLMSIGRMSFLRKGPVSPVKYRGQEP